MRRMIPPLIAGTLGTLMIVAFFVPPAQPWQATAEEWFTIVAAIAFLIGGTNLLLQHAKIVSRQQAGWGFSCVTLLAFGITSLVGLLKLGAAPSESAPQLAWSGPYQQEGTPFWWIFEYILSPITATMFSLLAFYVASAAFRAFRAKNIAATLLLGTAFIVLLSRCYAGALLTSWVPESMPGLTLPGFSGSVIMAIVTTAGQRSIMIGIALGIAAISLRIILGLDRSYLGSEQE
jgi:hypothetical protein